MNIKGKVPVISYQQYRRTRKLVHEGCNYDNGNCIALDDGEECICVQSISYSLLCKWFRAAVLSSDKTLEAALLFGEEMKRCAVCGQPFLPGSNRVKYCRPCAAKVHRKQKNASDRKRRLLILCESGLPPIWDDPGLDFQRLEKLMLCAAQIPSF